jgi:hypothetical protein
MFKNLKVSWWFYHVNQCELLGDARVDMFLHYESLAHDLARLPFPLPESELPCLESTTHENWETYYDERSEELIWTWAREDFERFGYKRLDRSRFAAKTEQAIETVG